MLKNTLTTKKSLLIAGGIAGVLVLGGGGVAIASGSDDHVSTQSRDRAQEAALAETGGGTVTEVDTLDDGLVGYEVEVVLPDGREAKVLLDGDYAVTSSRVDDDSSRSVTTPAPVAGDDSPGSAATPTPLADDSRRGSVTTPTPVPADDSGHHSGSRVDDHDGDDDHGHDDDDH
ncbi:hypothetical protein ABID81_002429 [Frigoribacterium sp. PvP054]|uniref:PepSY domain-containing protein n=1 Tax=Frigoribacterium sp. PvP054 TaxID=3156438 RepID=UPI003398D8DC